MLPNRDLAIRPRRFSGLPAAVRKEERRRLLLDSAFHLMGTAGLEAMTVRAVLEGARLNPRYFYESFADTDELAVGVYDRVVEELGAAVWGALVAAGDVPAEQLRAVVAATVEFVDADRRRGRVLYAAGLGNEPLNRRRAETAGMVVAFVEDHAADRPSDRAARGVSRAATSVLVGGFNQLLVDWLAGRIPVERDELVDDATALFLALGDGVAAVTSARRAPLRHEA
jgi:AcrR family transcriptional regulator